MPRLLQRSRDHGGVTAIVLGRMGSGKTTFLLSYLVRPLLESGEKLYWRGGPFCQWGYLRVDQVKLLLSPDIEYRWFDRAKGGPIDLEDLGIEYSWIYDIQDALWKADRGRLNILYVSDEGFRDFMEAANERGDIDWISVFHDEIQKLAPSNVGGDQWLKNKRLADAIAETRKNYVSFYCAAQDFADVDYRVRRKMMYRVYLQDARPPRDSLVWRSVPRRLKPGEAIVEGSYFTKVKFEKLRRQLHVVVKLREV